MKGQASIALLFVVLLLIGCSHETPASTQKPPAYPGAIGWTERTLTTNDNLLNIYRAVSFTTTDSPDTVLKFYRDTLTKEDWQVDPFQPDPNGLIFKWSSYEEPPAQYLLEVRARPGADGKTEVEVEQRFNPGG